MAELRWLLTSRTLIGVLHTTEGDTVEAAWRTLRQQNAAPHFIAGENKIVQCRPLNVQASTLRPGRNNTANVHAQIQIEMVARSRQGLWLPKAATLEPTVAILAFCEKTPRDSLESAERLAGRLLGHAAALAANNRRRRQAQRGLWPKEKGWWMHLEVPYQGPTWHWDCGAVRRTRLLALARQ